MFLSIVWLKLKTTDLIGSRVKGLTCLSSPRVWPNLELSWEVTAVDWVGEGEQVRMER